MSDYRTDAWDLYWQNNVEDFTGVRMVIHKNCQGDYFYDPALKRRWPKIVEQTELQAQYLWPVGGISIKDQFFKFALRYLDSNGGLPNGRQTSAVDLEWKARTNERNINADEAYELGDRIAQWQQKKSLGYLPPKFFEQNLNSDMRLFDVYDLWLADPDPPTPAIGIDRSMALIHQWGDPWGVDCNEIPNWDAMVRHCRGSWAVPIVTNQQFDPAVIMCPIVSELVPKSGIGVWLLGIDGGVYAFGGAPFYGSAAGQEYFFNRKAASLEYGPNGGYVIVATSGERYGSGGEFGPQ